ncbi:acyl-CoA thioesterase [Pseudomarimonas arenosa]|uniref:Acyl-CoA thioesterase n=1 Tax=Pseudomarimonas arenosa TaxID=2774145 RepID=A0AAW3ZN04_9GAMM|nr:thioesterase family protein [Pseudomarimonas arenosa]MBD8526554.1 acyl-CoA thioesterase [Pseudomarimonas arenosa]
MTEQEKDSKPKRKSTNRRKKPAAKKSAAKKSAAKISLPAPNEAEATDATCSNCHVIEVRWRDLDAFNHVNNATFLTYLEEARLLWLESLDGEWLTETSAPVLAAANLQFRRPVAWPETVRVELRSSRVGRSSITLEHRIVSANQPDVLYCDGSVVMVWVDATSGKGADLPPAVRRAAEALLPGQ